MTDQAKQDADGWMPHDGSGMPCDGDMRVYIIMRDGYVSTEPVTARTYYWKYGTPLSMGDITHWRPHRTADEQPAIAATSDTPETDAFYAAQYSNCIPLEMLESVIKEEKEFARDLERRLSAAAVSFDTAIKRLGDTSYTLGKTEMELSAEKLRAEAAERERDEAMAELASVKADYHELIMAVGNKYPNETRHQTALRYIKNAEDSGDNRPCDARASTSEWGKK